MGVDTLSLKLLGRFPPYSGKQILLQVGKSREGNRFRYEKADIYQENGVLPKLPGSAGSHRWPSLRVNLLLAKACVSKCACRAKTDGSVRG